MAMTFVPKNLIAGPSDSKADGPKPKKAAPKAKNPNDEESSSANVAAVT
jgi:hypothetical protein